MESVLGATPHEFKSRILRSKDGPRRRLGVVGGRFVVGAGGRRVPVGGIVGHSGCARAAARGILAAANQQPSWVSSSEQVGGKRTVIFKRIGEGRPYPDHGRTHRAWAEVSPRQIRLDQLVTTKRQLDLDALLADDSTFYGDLFAHVVKWQGEFFLEDGLHRAVRAALQQRTVLHARVLDLDL